MTGKLVRIAMVGACLIGAGASLAACNQRLIDLANPDGSLNGVPDPDADADPSANWQTFAPGVSTCVRGPFPYPTGGSQPTCRVIDRFGIDPLTHTPVGQLVFNCQDPEGVTRGPTPCWTAQPDSACSQGELLLQITRGSEPFPDGVTGFSCVPCPQDHIEVGCRL